MDYASDFKEILTSIKPGKYGDQINPHKYLFLLAICYLFDKDANHANSFSFDEIESIFLEIFNTYFPEIPNYRKMIEYPFYHIQSDGFWHMHLIAGKEELYYTYQKKRLTKKRLRETVDYGYLNEFLYSLIKNSDRQLIKKEIEVYLNRCKSSKEGLPLSTQVESDYLTVEESTSLYEHEQTAIDIIKHSINSNNLGKTLSNILIHDTQSNMYFECDLVLVVHTGIFVVELKHWSGNIRIAPYNWVVNETFYRTDPHKSNIYKCKVLKGIYEHRFPAYPRTWVESVVVLTNPDAVVEGACEPGQVVEKNTPNPSFASLTDFITYLRKKEAAFSGPRLDDAKIEAVIAYLRSLDTPRRSIKYSVPGYETLEYLSQTPECIELVARRTDSQARGLQRFRVFRPPAQASPEERRRFLKKANNTLNAVTQIGDHPNIHRVWLMENEDGDIIEGSDWSETGTLRDLICMQQEALPASKVFSICYNIALGLNKAHEAGIIHRAIKPENIILMNDIPQLINFDLAYQVEENHITVIADVSHLKDDGYIAPEILQGQDIDEGTDFFSLGVIACELLIGQRPFVSVRQFAAQGGRLNPGFLEKLRNNEVPEQTISIIEAMVVADRMSRCKDAEKILAAFTWPGDKNEIAPVSEKGNARLEPGEQHDVYEIIQYIGEGKEAQIYQAITLGGQQVALKIFNREIPLDRILREATVTSDIHSSYVVRCDNRVGHWDKDRYFLVLEYVDGESMRAQITNGERPDVETFKTIALSLMEGLKAFHEHRDDEGNPQPYLHSDIKPDNILITRDKKAVIIDCGIAGEPRVDLFQGTLPYVAPDSILGSEMEFSFQGDIFSLGVSLWEWVWGSRPYEVPTVGDKPIWPPEDSFWPISIRAWLQKAVATESKQRYGTIEEMQKALLLENEILHPKAQGEAGKIRAGAGDAKLLFEEEQVELGVEHYSGGELFNPFVQYLISLSNASAANENATAEAQVGNAFFERIRVDNPVASFIIERLQKGDSHVILTGNAGDGKTTLAAEVLESFTGTFRPLRPIEDLPEKNLVIIKDMSELEEEQRTQILSEAMKSRSKRFLIVSNTGTLLESFRKVSSTGDESELLKALKADHPQTIKEDRFLVVNLGRVNSIESACQVFRRMLAEENWKECLSCSCSSDCPIHINVQLLREDRERVADRVKLIYRRLYEYGSRLTIRQMTGHLAYAVTAGRDCRQVINMSEIGRQAVLPDALFFNNFFGDGGGQYWPEAQQLLPVREIRRVEFGYFLDSFYERKTWIQNGDSIELPAGARNYFNILLKLEKNHSSARIQMRRLLYFFASLDDEAGNQYISLFLRSPRLLEYMRLADSETGWSRRLESEYRRLFLQVFQEFITGVRLPEGSRLERDLYITLRPRDSLCGTQMVLAQIRAEDFIFRIKSRYKFGQVDTRVLTVELNSSGISLELDLPLLDYIARRHDGEIAEELSPYYADRLEQFKVELMENYTVKNEPVADEMCLLRIGADRRFQIVRMMISGERLEVLS